MYVLIIVIGILSPATSSVVPVGVTSQIVGKFKNLDDCKAAAGRPLAGGIISDLSLTRGVYWYCAYSVAGELRLAGRPVSGTMANESDQRVIEEKRGASLVVGRNNDAPAKGNPN
jgi:hypothetical protein